MKCGSCGFWGPIDFPKCPVCGTFSKKNYWIVKLKQIFSWIRDRRFCLISKRQKIDRSLYRTHLIPSNCRGMHRIWWVYLLFDVIPILIVQDPTSVFIFDPPPEQKPPEKDSTNNMGMMS